MQKPSFSKLARAAGRFRVSVDDVFWLIGAGLAAAGAALIYLPAGLLVAGALFLLLSIGGSNAR
jgi:hypothetical protein